MPRRPHQALRMVGFVLVTSRLSKTATIIMGRSSVDIIKSGGYKLSALEMKINSRTPIAEVAVVGQPDRTWGEAVAAVVVLKGGRL